MLGYDAETGYAFKLLHDKAVAEDTFEEKTHSRISSSLFKLIKAEDKGITIGLEGGWGAGKSTVINLLSGHFQDETNSRTVFFIFDAWSHEGDPLRRIFLESLIKEIDPESKNDDLNSILEKSSGRARTVITKVRKSTSKLGKRVSFFALLLPFGSALLSRANGDHFVMPWSNLATTPNWFFIFGMTLCLAPIIYLIFWYFFGDKDKETDKRIWDIFTAESTESSTQDISDDSERTSIEFEEYFNRISRLTIEKQIADRIVIVIDNIDRVSTSHATNILSTLQAFFQRKSIPMKQNEVWRNKVWFIIPFDRTGLAELWSDKSSGRETKQIATSFVKKYFQVVEEVPEPVMSNWSDFAKKCIKEGLHGWPEIEQNCAFTTFALLHSKLDESPTPRNIKLFVNKVGLLGSIWGRVFSTESICAYAIFRDTRTAAELRTELVSGEILNFYQAQNDPKILIEELAGLLFGVNKEKGVQLLLGPEIKSAIESGDGGSLSQLLALHSEAFWIAFNASKREWLPTLQHNDNYKALVTKAIHDGLIHQKGIMTNVLKEIIGAWTQPLNLVEVNGPDRSETMRQLLSFNVNSNEIIDAIYRHVKSQLDSTIEKIEDLSDTTKSDAIKNLKALEMLLYERNRPIEVKIYDNLTKLNWIKWMNICHLSNVTFRSVLPENNTITGLAEDIISGKGTMNASKLTLLTRTYDIHKTAREWMAIARIVAKHLSDPPVKKSNGVDEACNLLQQLFKGENTEIHKIIEDKLKNTVYWKKIDIN